MNIELRHGLPYICAEIEYHGQQVKIENVLLDTGSAGCIFDADRLSAIGLHYEPFDLVQRIRGVGGAEFVFTKKVDRLALGGLAVSDFAIEIGAMDYEFEIAGIVGMTFLTAVGAVIDLAKLEIATP